MVTTYDYPFRVHLGMADIDIALVDDSAATVVHEKVEEEEKLQHPELKSRGRREITRHR